MEYYIGFLNKTGHNLDEVSVYSGNNLWGLPTPLVVGGKATEGVITMAIPTEAEVRIVDHGEQKSVKVSLKNVPEEGFEDGTIFFVIYTNDTVEVKPVKIGDDAAMAEVMKGLRPEGEYRFAFVNRTGHELQAVTVYYGGKKTGTGGNVLARSQANFTYSDPLTMPCPAEAELRWIEDGTPHTVKVKLEGVPKGFEGRIFFVIKADDTVQVHPVKNGDDKSAFELVK